MRRPDQDRGAGAARRTDRGLGHARTAGRSVSAKKLLSADEFRAAAKAGKAPDGAQLRKAFVAEIKADGTTAARSISRSRPTASIAWATRSRSTDGSSPHSARIRWCSGRMTAR